MVEPTPGKNMRTVKLDHETSGRGEHKTYLKPPTSLLSWSWSFKSRLSILSPTIFQIYLSKGWRWSKWAKQSKLPVIFECIVQWYSSWKYVGSSVEVFKKSTQKKIRTLHATNLNHLSPCYVFFHNFQLGGHKAAAFFTACQWSISSGAAGKLRLHSNGVTWWISSHATKYLD